MRRKILLAAAMLCAGCTTAAAAPADVSAVKAYRIAHEKEIVSEFATLLSLPNVATNLPDIQRNADFISSALQRRGFRTELLRAGPGTPPSIFGELSSPGAKRTIVFYAHYDGQPVSQDGWRTDPFKPVMRSGIDAASSEPVDWRKAAKLDPEWRIYARSSSDDKVPIQALLSALDALKAAGRRPAVNVKVFYEGEEEQGSRTLPAILASNAAKLRGDVFIFSDGPRHQTGRTQIFFGARGATALDLTVYGPARPLHSGHYGNWAPNPALMLTRLLASMRDEDGKILIPGFSRTVRPLNAAERKAIAQLPDVESQLKRELALGRTEGRESLLESVARPALNIRGIRAGAVGEGASNTIATEARASIDFRLVPDQTPAEVRNSVEAFLRRSGWHVVHSAPTLAERAAHPRVVRVDWTMSYPAYRTSLNSAEAEWLARAMEEGTGEAPLRVPMIGGSVPMKLFGEALGMPIIGLPLANYDNNQHGANENLRLQNLWDGIDIYAAMLTSD